MKSKNRKDDVKLLWIGSCRNEGDRQRVKALRSLVTKLEFVTDDVIQFSIDPPYSELQQSMQLASMGIHTMRQEHFGIGIVEMMAAGLVTIAHNSGGPQTDIVEQGETGFLTTTADDYAEAIHQALTMTKDDSETMRRRAQMLATRISDQIFEESLERVLPQLVSSKNDARYRKQKTKIGPIQQRLI